MHSYYNKLEFVWTVLLLLCALKKKKREPSHLNILDVAVHCMWLLFLYKERKNNEKKKLNAFANDNAQAAKIRKFHKMSKWCKQYIWFVHDMHCIASHRICTIKREARWFVQSYLVKSIMGFHIMYEYNITAWERRARNQNQNTNTRRLKQQRMERRVNNNDDDKIGQRICTNKIGATIE